MNAPGSEAWRTLNACPDCARQYDVSHLSVGARVACTCGRAFEARFPRPHSPRHVRCSSCGGNLQLDAPRCPYCSAEVTLEEKHLTSICPGCCARVLDRAGFCMECGIAIQPQAIYALPEAAACPRCKGALRARELAEAPIVECAACGGLWLSEERFDAFCASTEERERVSVALGHTPAPAAVKQDHPVSYLPCVVCADMMTRRNFAGASGVILDVCRKHGVWLDHSELEKVLAFIRDGGLDRARRVERERLDRARARRDSDSHLPMIPEGRLSRGARMPTPDLLSWALERVFDLWD